MIQGYRLSKQLLVGIAVVVILCLLVVALSAFRTYQLTNQQLHPTPQPFSFSPTPTPPALIQQSSLRWSKYSSGKHRFSILYPEGWIAQETERDSKVGPLIDFAPAKLRELDQTYPELWIEVVSKPVSQQLESWVDNQVLQPLPTQLRSQLVINPIRIRSRQGLEISGLPGISPNLQYFFANSDTVYRLTISPYLPENSSQKDIHFIVRQLREIMLPSLDIQD